MSRGKAAKPLTKRQIKEAQASVVNPCRYETPEEKCGRSAVRGSPFCLDHRETVGTLERLEEQNALGGRAVAEQLRAEVLGEAPEVAATRLAKQMLGVGEREYPEEREAAVTAHEAPEIAATRVAKQLLAERAAASKAAEARRERRGSRTTKEKSRVPLHVQLDIPDTTDLTAMVDEKGNSLVRPGWIPRWIRTVGLDGKPSGQRWREFQAFGAKKVEMPEDMWLQGMIPIQIPPDGYAKRVIKYSKVGAFNLDEVTNANAAAVDAANREAGREVAEFHVGSNHGSREYD